MEIKLKIPQSHGSIHSMIPILYAECKDLQLAFNRTADFLASKVKEFQETAQRLLTFTKQYDAVEVMELEDFIRGCQFICTGNLSWR